jgi:hypothetical protein
MLGANATPQGYQARRIFSGAVIVLLVVVDEVTARRREGSRESLEDSARTMKGEDASPYINHPLAVAHLLADTGGITMCTR